MVAVVVLRCLQIQRWLVPWNYLRRRRRVRCTCICCVCALLSLSAPPPYRGVCCRRYDTTTSCHTLLLCKSLKHARAHFFRTGAYPCVSPHALWPSVLLSPFTWPSVLLSPFTWLQHDRSFLLNARPGMLYLHRLQMQIRKATWEVKRLPTW